MMKVYKINEQKPQKLLHLCFVGDMVDKDKIFKRKD